MTILMLVHNEKEQTINAIEHLRSLSEGGEPFSLILVDNASTDSLKEWATKQEDISYAYMEQGMEPWGSVLAQCKDSFPFDDEILMMQSRFLPLPGTIDRMRELLVADDCAIATCITTRAEMLDQQPEEDIQSVVDAESYMRNHLTAPVYRVLAPGCGLFMVKTSVLCELEIDAGLWTLSALATSFAIQSAQKGYRCCVARNAVAFEDEWEFPEAVDSIIHLEDDKKRLEERWRMHYFAQPNPWMHLILDAERDARITVLEIGCDCGATLLSIKNRFPNSYTIGCDITESAIGIAGGCADKAFVANIENEDIPIDEESVDYIIFGDVLEHLHDPSRVLRYVRRLLKPEGKILASIPNVMHVSVMRQLLSGDFSYTEIGLLDKTHIHLFTFNEIVRIFKENGYVPELVNDGKVEMDEEDKRIVDELMKISNGVDRFMYEAYQYQVRARKA